jgi:hypothetical protein
MLSRGRSGMLESFRATRRRYAENVAEDKRKARTSRAGHALPVVDKRWQKKNAAARLRRRETKARSLAAKAEAQARIARGERGDGRPRRQVSRIDYKILTNTGGRVAKTPIQHRGATVKREAI